jgi:hypothetical protein
MDKLSEVINPENIDVPGLVEVLKGMEERLCDIEEVLKIDRTVKDEDPVYLSEALEIARVWRAGKMIGGNEGVVRNALLYEVERLHVLIKSYGGDALIRMAGMSQP